MRALPFSSEEFLTVFAEYNEAIWPLQLVAYVFGAIGLAPAVWRRAGLDRLAAAALALMWVFTGVAYHWRAFAHINSVAYLFGAAFVLEGALIAYAGSIGVLSFERPRSGLLIALAIILVIYSAFVYPIIGLALHGYPSVPLFGITPCPVTLYTLAILLLTSRRPWWLFVVPVGWAFVGGSAAVLLAVPQDWVLLASAPTVIAILLLGSRRPTQSQVDHVGISDCARSRRPFGEPSMLRTTKMESKNGCEHQERAGRRDQKVRQ